MPAASPRRPTALLAARFALAPTVLSCNRTEEHPCPRQAVKSSLMCRMKKLRGFSVLNIVLQSRNLSSSRKASFSEGAWPFHGPERGSSAAGWQLHRLVELLGPCVCQDAGLTSQAMAKLQCLLWTSPYMLKKSNHCPQEMEQPYLQSTV